jgi:hypothetical protein
MLMNVSDLNGSSGGLPFIPAGKGSLMPESTLEAKRGSLGIQGEGGTDTISELAGAASELLRQLSERSAYT